MIPLFVTIFAYLCGSIPFGLILTRMAGYGDIRQMGSGNIGSTNVLRTGNKKLAAATLLLDGIKGIIPVMLVHLFFKSDLLLAVACIAAVLGHVYPVWLKFKGGKGVATSLGVCLGLSPLSGLISCLVWLAMAFGFRYSSLSALVAISAMPLIYFILTNSLLPTLALCLIAALVVFKHRANIERLRAGIEPKIGAKAKE